MLGSILFFAVWAGAGWLSSLVLTHFIGGPDTTTFALSVGSGAVAAWASGFGR